MDRDDTPASHGSASADWTDLLDRAVCAFPERGYRGHAARLRLAGYAVSDYDVRLYLAENDLTTPDERRAYANTQPRPPVDTPDEAEARVVTAEALVREGRARATLRRLRAEDRALVQTAVEQTEFLDELRAIVRAMPPLAPIAPPSPDTRTHQPKTLCLVLSDLHVGSLLDKDDARGQGEYDLDIFRRRVARLCDAITRITADERANSVIQNFVCFMLGDNVEGRTLHTDQIWQTASLTDQLRVGTETLARDLLRPLAALFPRIHVVRVIGNHGRIADPGLLPFSDSTDAIFYHWLESRLEAFTNIAWGPIRDYDDLVTLHGWTFRATHGQNQKGSARVPLVPARNGTREYAATYRRTPDVSLAGHLHSVAYGLDNRTHLLCNGSMPGVSEYGLKHGFSEIPMQLLFAVNDVAPVQALYPIYLEDRRAYTSAAPRDVFAPAS